MNICKRCRKDVDGIHTCSLPADDREALIVLTELWLDGESKPLPSFIEDHADQLIAAGFKR